MHIKENDTKDLNVKKIYVSVLALFVAFFGLVSVFCFSYYQKLCTTIYEESEMYLQEISRRTGSNVDRLTKDNYAVLQTMGVSLASMEKPTFARSREILSKQFELWNYKQLFFIDDTGKSYDLESNELFLSLDDDTRNSILSGKNTISYLQTVQNEEHIAFFVPLEGISIEGKQMIALAGSYSTMLYDQVLSMSAFEESAFSQIISRNGTVVIRSSHESSVKTGFNVLNSLNNAKMGRQKTVEDIRNELQLGASGQADLTLEGEHLYMVYTPMEQDDWYLITFVPVEFVNSKSDMLLQSTLIISGLISFAFASMSVLLIYFFREHRRKLEKIAYVDEVTGGLTIQKFYLQAEKSLRSNSGEKFALIYTNIVNFKVMNEQLGRKNCDDLLIHFDRIISEKLSEKECIGRIGADNFCVWVTYTSEESIVQRLQEWCRIGEDFVAKNNTLWTIPITEFGIYIRDDDVLTFPQMMDRAKLALDNANLKAGQKINYAFYNDKIRLQMLRQKQIEDWMEVALENQEFQVYLQPKYHIEKGRVGGAEALVRWKRPDGTMIFPDEFIPLFERNGFIVQLDLWVFEKVCKTLSTWKEEQRELVKISVNCSRVHLRDSNFLEPFREIVTKYNVDKSLLEIELTESVFLDNSNELTQAIQGIRESGFGCSMDDFGSGYSSLNLLQSIPVDTLKLDKIFFKPSASYTPSPLEEQRARAIVRSVIIMAKDLSMEVVAEGVEEAQQVEMLRDSGCDYIQGYVFARPMPIKEFENFAFEHNQQKLESKEDPLCM